MTRNTKQRDAILDIVNHSYDHLTAYEIYEKCRSKIPNVSLGTVYRNLNLLVEEHCIKKIVCEKDVCRYDHMKREHSHFICKNCGKIIDVFDNFLDGVTNIHGNVVNGYDLYFNGVCSECLKGGMKEHGTKRK